jgi:hypothetical protein
MADIKNIYDGMLKDMNMFTSGRRNDDAVDFSIVCWCLDYDPMEKFDELAIEHGFFDDTQYDIAKEHMERVQPYLEDWGERGTMDAMKYCINY